MNRKKLMSALGASIVAITMNYSDIHGESKMAKVTASSLNFRTGPSTTYKSITSIKQGTTVEVLGYSGDWAIIKYSNVTGYVAKRYLTEINTSTPTQSTSPITAIKMTVTASSLNVRSGAGTSNKVIGSLTKGKEVEVVEKLSNGWCKIKYGSGYGYVSGDYLKAQTTAPAPAPTTPTPTQPTSPVTVTKMNVTASSLNVRSGAGTSNKTIGSLAKGTEVGVVEKLSNGWCKIKYGRGYGYVSGDYLKAQTTSTPAPAPQPTPPPTPTQPTSPVTVTKMTVTASSLNVRSGAGTSNKVIGSLTKGKEVEVVEKLSNGWCKIKYGSGYGYVSGDYLKAQTTAPAPQPQPPTEEPTPTPQPDATIKMNVTASSLNVRSGAGTSNKTIGSLAKGTEVEVVEKLSNGWCKIKYGSGYGYVSGDYLGEQKPTQNPDPIVDSEKVEVKYVNSTTLNIRDNPSGIVLGVFRYGDKVEVVEKLSNGWSKIKYNNGYAYVYSSYLSNEVGQRPLPIPTATPVIADPGQNNKPTIAVDIGHNVSYNTGAVYGVYREDYLTKVVGEKVISKLRSMGYHVIETLPKSASSNVDALKQRTDLAKLSESDIFVSIHFNAGKGQGTEVFYSSEGNAKTIGSNIANNIASLGFKNRGVKYGEYITNQQSGMYLLNQTDMPAVLVEGFFLDSSDMDKFIDMGPSAYDKIADAIVNGLIK